MTTDPSLTVITRVMQSSMSYDLKMGSLLSLEAQIADNFSQGKSSVKPISLMTPDDLID